MITNKDLEAVNLSVTKKDFYQIWNELLDTAKKLSDRWSPDSTNESDPGIVLLKVLTAIADKLNYTIDKNTLEAFMPSAAQEDSMRKLCDMMGYNMKYYQSATTDVTIAYSNAETKISEKLSESGLTSITLPKYTNIKNTDEDINYFTLDPVTLDDNISTKVVECMEGVVNLCADDTNNIVMAAQLDDSNRYFLPENQIAENGLFITNISDELESELWEKVENLNVQPVGKKCFKFGFDSKTQTPFVQFPDDIATIIEDGLIIRYTSTNGVNGNISYNVLNVLEVPEGLSTYFASSDFAVKNASATANGRNKESLTDAYNNYKKTIGTFDTLVTCRDYINKIYQMTTDDANTTPLVSNINVSDVRDDINRAINLCTFNDYGIAYVDQTLIHETKDRISHFDLVLYPFTTINGSATYDSYNNSFKYSAENLNEIKLNLENNKTISHHFVDPDAEDIVAIKNYLRLKAKITTTYKVTELEEKLILNNIYYAIYENFNARKIDFGEEIPFDTILSVIQNADTRIKNVALEEPVLYTKLLGKDGSEDSASTDAKFNKLALRNILAGRLPLFDYNEDFKPSFNEKAYGNSIEPVYPTDNKIITKVESEFNVFEQSPADGLILNENEIIQFRAPNFKTVITYPAYINYFLHLTTPGTKESQTTIKAGTEYKFGDAEWLAINYTPSITNDDGTTSTGNPINIVYGGKNVTFRTNTTYTVFKPNFDMIDSIIYKQQGHTPSKTSGYDGMPNEAKQIINDTTGGVKAGMHTFGTNEQVEIRGIVEIKLNGNVTNIYWERNDEENLDKDNNKIIFDWDEDPVYVAGSETEIDYYKSYTIKEGEYIYYTDEAKIDLAYYGNGTKITRTNKSIELYKWKTDAEKLADKIANEGLLAALPWVSYTFGSTNYLVLTEYQYINLTTGDKLTELNTDQAQTAKICALTKNWSADINSAEYQLSSDSQSTQLTIISDENARWKARSILSFNMAPAIAQTLHSTGIPASGSIPTLTQNKLTIYYRNDTASVSIEPKLIDGRFLPLSLQSNYILQSSSGKETISSDITNFKIKTFKTENSTISTNIGNFGTNWTKISFGEQTPNFKLNINLQNNNHGLIMFYNIDTNQTLTNHAYITVSDSQTINICNASNGSAEKFTGDKTWWVDGTADGKYYLRTGINVVEIPSSCTLTINADTDKKAIIVFSNLDLVKYSSNNFNINPRAAYENIDKGSAIVQALYDIAQIDKDYNFYYNAIIDNSTTIDFNTNITDPAKNEYETLRTPTIWYDYNNINNKFVISEINLDDMKDGITLTSASRK